MSLFHIPSIIFKARCRTAIIVWSFLSHKISLLRQAYITCVRRIIEYASQVWNPSVLEYISDLEKVQMNFTYRIRSIQYLCYPEQLAVLNLESLELRKLKADLIMYYKILNNLIRYTSMTTLLYGNPLQSQLVHLVPILYSHFVVLIELPITPFFRFIYVWNTLPVTITNATTLFAFKRLLSMFYLSPYLFGNFHKTF